jgi:hypothetical protein
LREVWGVFPVVQFAKAQHIPDWEHVSLVVLRAQGEVTIVGATIVRVIGPFEEIDGDKWSSEDEDDEAGAAGGAGGAGGGEPPKNLLWPLEVVDVFVS